MATITQFAEIAALAGDPARAQMLHALMDGRALSATELAAVGGVTAQTASGHLGRLPKGQPLAGPQLRSPGWSLTLTRNFQTPLTASRVRRRGMRPVKPYMSTPVGFQARGAE